MVGGKRRRRRTGATGDEIGGKWGGEPHRRFGFRKRRQCCLGLQCQPVMLRNGVIWTQPDGDCADWGDVVEVGG